MANQLHGEIGTREAAPAVLVLERLVTADSEIASHLQQDGTSIEIRKSRELQVRLIVQDGGDVPIIGKSLNMKDYKATDLRL